MDREKVVPAAAHLIVIARECYKTALAHGWWEDGSRSPDRLAALLHTEISEYYEEYRNGNELRHTYYNDTKPEGMLVELADVLIRMLDYIEYEGQTELFITKLLEKMEYNERRAYKHGGKKS